MFYILLILITSLVVVGIKLYVQHKIPQLKNKSWNLKDIEEYPEIHKKLKIIIFGLVFVFVIVFIATSINSF